MSAECDKHGCHLLGYMEDAFCPACRYEVAESHLARLEEALKALATVAEGHIRDSDQGILDQARSVLASTPPSTGEHE